MKKLIIVILVFLIADSIFGQEKNSFSSLTGQDYLLKSKHQKTAAWVLLSSGVTIDALSLAFVIAKTTADVGYMTVGVFAGVPPHPEHSYKTENAFLIGGSLIALSSIPLFISSAKNKRKALSLSFKSEIIQQIQNKSFVNTPIPSLNISIRL